MAVGVGRQWKHFSASPSGRRFKARYRLRRARKNGLLWKILITGVGIVVMLAGVAMLVLPGPGILALVIGAALVAEESLFAARMLDRIDVWVSARIAAWRARRS